MYPFSQLRNFLDGREPFMTNGFDVRGKPRSGHSERLRRIPGWAKDDAQVKALLLRAFPKLLTDQRQKDRAMRWLRIINLYYRVGWTSGRVAEELHVSEKYVTNTLRRITQAAAGLRTDGKERKNRMGRPKVIRL